MKNNLPFTAWVRWFENFRSRQLHLPRPPGPELSREEARLIGPSIRKFQLGESSDARKLLAKAGRYAAQTGDISYPAALIAFAREENRHAAMLGRFMDQEGISRAKKDPMDGIFRFLRHRVGLRSSITILLSAEFIAVPYYTALAKASPSILLKAICKQILLDEDKHIQFQSLALKEFARKRNRFQRRLDNLFARTCIEIALDLVWFSHGGVLQAGGYDYTAYRQACLSQFRLSRQMVEGELPIPEPNPEPQPYQMPFGVRISHPKVGLDALAKRAVTRGMFQTPDLESI